MKHVLILILLFATSAWAEGQEDGPDSDVSFAEQYMSCSSYDAATCEGKASQKFCQEYNLLPPDIREKIDMDMQCNFLAGEISGDAEQDAKTNEAINSLGCPANDADSLSLLRENWGKEPIMHALLFFATDYMAAADACLKEENGHD